MSVSGVIVGPLVVVSGVVAAGLAIASWWNRHRPGMYWFAIHVFLVSVWSLIDFISYTATSIWMTEVFGLVADGIGYPTTVAWFLFIVTYLGYDDRMNDWQARLLMFGLGGVTCILFSTTHLTGLMAQNISVIQWESTQVLVIEPTLVTTIARSLLFLLSFIGLGLLFHAGASGRLQPAQATILLVATLSPVIIEVLLLLSTIPVGVPLTQSGAALSVVLYVIGLHRYDLFQFSPATERIGIDRAFGELDAGVLVAEADGHIIKANDTCCTMLETSREQLIGSTVNSVLSSFGLRMVTLPEIVEYNNRYYRISDSTVSNDSGVTIGHSVLFLDVTEQRLREQRLDVLNRVLRHNIRNDLQVIKTTNEVLAENITDEYTQMADRAIKTADDLIATSNKARSVEQQLEDMHTQRQFDVSAVVQSILETYRARFPEVSFTLTCPEDCFAEAPSSLEMVLENLIENAAKHNDSPTPTVDITVTEYTDTATVEVTDNGPGIAAHELAVFDEGKETALDHASGMGLWAVHWVIAHSAVEVEYDTRSTGTTVTIQIPH